MAKGILTNRELKNKVTGVDIYVSDYQEVPHRVKNEYLYHVIVVSNLFYYKTREHRESDVVQFMVSKTFQEFEDLYWRLLKRFPSVNFPALPKKNSVSVNAGGNLECMDKVLKMVASTQKLSSSPMLISFMRGDSKSNVREETEIEEPELEINDQEVVNGVNQQDGDEFHDVDLFATKGEEAVEEEIFTENIENVSAGVSIFDEDIMDDTSAGGGDTDLFATDDVERNTQDDVNAELNVLELSDSDSEVDELMNLKKLCERQPSIEVEVRKTHPSKQRMNIFSKECDNIFDCNKTENLFEDKKEDMFKKSKQTDKKCLWRDHNHHTLDDIFCSKETSLFGVDDGDDIFRNSKKKVMVKKVEDMQQEDIMEYIKQHNGESTTHNKEKENNTIVPTENGSCSVPTELNPLEHDTGVYITEQVECSIATNVEESNVISFTDTVDDDFEQIDAAEVDSAGITEVGKAIASMVCTTFNPTAEHGIKFAPMETCHDDDVVEGNNDVAQEQKDEVEVSFDIEHEYNTEESIGSDRSCSPTVPEHDLITITEECEDDLLTTGEFEDNLKPTDVYKGKVLIETEEYEDHFKDEHNLITTEECAQNLISTEEYEQTLFATEESGDHFLATEESEHNLIETEKYEDHFVATVEYEHNLISGKECEDNLLAVEEISLSTEDYSHSLITTEECADSPIVIEDHDDSSVGIDRVVSMEDKLTTFYMPTQEFDSPTQEFDTLNLNFDIDGGLSVDDTMNFSIPTEEPSSFLIGNEGVVSVGDEINIADSSAHSFAGVEDGVEISLETEDSVHNVEEQHSVIESDTREAYNVV